MRRWTIARLMRTAIRITEYSVEWIAVSDPEEPLDLQK